jgi:hypothetical protein
MCHVKLPFKTNWITFVLCVIAVVASELALAAPKEAKITKPKPLTCTRKLDPPFMRV